LVAAKLIELAGITAPFGSDNVRALRANQRVPEGGDLGPLVPSPQSLREMVDAAR
jgi:hypothetical protein